METEDGFTITLHRIPPSKRISNNNPPVLFAPPLMSSSFDWVNHGSNYSLGLLLSDLGMYFQFYAFYMFISMRTVSNDVRKSSICFVN